MANQDDQDPEEDGTPEQRDDSDPPPPAPHKNKKPPELAKPPAKKNPPGGQRGGKPPKKKDAGHETAGNGEGGVVKNVSAVAIVTMKGADTWQRIIVFCLYLFAILAILGFWRLDQSKDRALFGIAALFCILFALVFILLNYKELSAKAAPEPAAPAPAPAPEPASGVAAAPEPKLPPRVELSPLAKEAIYQALGEAREYAFKSLRKIIPELQDKQIRANIFLPEYQRTGSEVTCVLRIRAGLHIHMDDPKERGIQFAPGHGATGLAFSEKDARVAVRLAAGAAPADWEEIYQLTPAQAQEVHPDLQWVISLPLKLGGECLGVLNIDGLVHQPGFDDLNALSFQFSKWILVIAAFMKES